MINRKFLEIGGTVASVFEKPSRVDVDSFIGRYWHLFDAGALATALVVGNFFYEEVLSPSVVAAQQLNNRSGQTLIITNDSLKTGCNYEGESGKPSQIIGTACFLDIPNTDGGIHLAGINDRIEGTSVQAYLRRSDEQTFKPKIELTDPQILRALKDPLSILIIPLSSRVHIHVIESVTKTETVFGGKRVIETEKSIIQVEDRGGGNWKVNYSLPWKNLSIPDELKGFKPIDNRVTAPNSFLVINDGNGSVIILATAGKNEEGLGNTAILGYKINTTDGSPSLEFIGKDMTISQARKIYPQTLSK